MPGDEEIPGAEEQPVPASRSRRRRWCLGGAAAVVVILAAVVITVVATRPSTAPRAGASAPPATPGCHLDILDHGFTSVSEDPVRAGGDWDYAGDIKYAFVVENPCAEAARDIRVDVEPLAADGSPVRARNGVDHLYFSPSDFAGLGPGERIAWDGYIAGGRTQYDADDVHDVRIRIVAAEFGSGRKPERWPVATVRDVALGDRDEDGMASLRFTVRGRDSTRLRRAYASVLFRDRRGRILCGDTRAHVRRGAQSARIWVPPGADPDRTQVYIGRGEAES